MNKYPKFKIGVSKTFPETIKIGTNQPCEEMKTGGSIPAISCGFASGAYDPVTIYVSRGKYGRSDRYYPACAFSEMLCDLIKSRTYQGRVRCLVEWQINRLKDFGFKVEIEDE